MTAISETHRRWSLRKTIEKLKPGSFTDSDNTTLAHLALSIKEFLTKHSISLVYHLPYSPYLEPSDFSFLFPKVERERDFSGCQKSSKVQYGNSTTSQKNILRVSTSGRTARIIVFHQEETTLNML
jgi:hypothetical protein